MYRVWKKMQRMQASLKSLNRQVTERVRNIKKNRAKIEQGQTLLTNDLLNPDRCQEVKFQTEKVIDSNKMEEKILQQKYKIDQIGLGG